MCKGYKGLRIKQVKGWLYFSSSSENRQSHSGVLTLVQTLLRRCCSFFRADPLTWFSFPPCPGHLCCKLFSSLHLHYLSVLGVRSPVLDCKLCYLRTAWLWTVAMHFLGLNFLTCETERFIIFSSCNCERQIKSSL